MATGGQEPGEFADTHQENKDNNESEDWNYAGLEVIDRACLEIYPDQPNPLQAAAVIKMWLGGPDPLDYVSIYSNSGDLDRGIPPHWHYVSCGFSDLHGDGRVHPFGGSSEPSGFGFELTLRLKKKDNEAAPPMWPSGLMNRLANYVFQTGNVLHIGDHIPWHKPLDEAEDTQSLVQHLLVTKDPQLPELTGPYGYLDFRQLVGVTDDEMKAAQKWKGTGVLELMSNTKAVGPFFITDIERAKSIFEDDSNLMHLVNDGINTDGSNLGHVTAVCMWADINTSLTPTKDENNEITEEEEEPEPLEGVHLMFDSEAADLLPVVVRGRLQKGRLFVFQNAENQAIHLVPPSCHEEGLFVNQTEPLKAQGGYLQNRRQIPPELSSNTPFSQVFSLLSYDIAPDMMGYQMYCSHSLLDRMAQELECLSDGTQDNQQYPREFRFSDPTILITVSPRGIFFGTDPSS